MQLTSYLPVCLIPKDMVHFDKIFPSFVTGMLREGLRDFGRKIKGFDRADAVLTGFETRTSAPIRIERGNDMCALLNDGVYPCGEGAGYAGGIVSAAVDGERCALSAKEYICRL